MNLKATEWTPILYRRVTVHDSSQTIICGYNMQLIKAVCVDRVVSFQAQGFLNCGTWTHRWFMVRFKRVREYQIKTKIYIPQTDLVSILTLLESKRTQPLLTKATVRCVFTCRWVHVYHSSASHHSLHDGHLLLLHKI